MNLEAIATQLTQVIQKEANIKAIFGEPIKLDEHTIIPVARVRITLGGGGGSGTGSTPTPGKNDGEAGMLGTAGASAGGGGLDIDVAPLGFIRDGAEGPTFIAIGDGLLGKVEHLIKGLRPGTKAVEGGH
jgi:uncharacterized spore protein YtfJ